MKLVFSKYCGGLHWIYTTDSGKHSLSIICNDASNGREKGLFETMCSWLPDVQGYLSFEQVARKIKHIHELEKRELKKKC